MSKYIVAVVVVLMFGFGHVFAETKVTFDQFDEDGDGYITKSEAADSSNMTKNWKQADKDSDNKLDVSEFSAFEGKERFVPADDMEEPEPGAAPTN